MELLPWLIGAYGLICLGGYFGNRLFMYFPDASRYAPSEIGLENVEEIELQTPDGVKLVAWHSKAEPGQPTILYFHGNAGNAAGRALKIDTMRRGGAGVLYVNNRGYGGSGGSPTEADNVADAITAYEHLRSLGVADSEIVLYGESLGSGQAVRLGGQKTVKAVVLEAPLTSTVDVARRTYFWLPLKLLLTDIYDNEKHVSEVKAPILILHGERDAVIPVGMGKRVYAAANEPKQIEIFPEAGHADLFEHGAWERVEAFLNALAER